MAALIAAIQARKQLTHGSRGRPWFELMQDAELPAQSVSTQLPELVRIKVRHADCINQRHGEHQLELAGSEEIALR